MSPVLEAIARKRSLTSSNSYNDWLNFLDEKSPIIIEQWFRFPDLSTYLVERADGNWVITNSGTIASQRSILQMESDIVDDIDSPLMPAKNQFAINLVIERVERGKPSSCDEVGL